jgi:Helix-turn-helix of DDE superfamily endonuclease
VCFLFFPDDACEQVIEKPSEDERRGSLGHRKLEVEERVLIFLTRLRRKTPFEELGYQYGCGSESARRYYNELIDIFHRHFVSRLVFPRSPDELREMSREEVLNQWPDLLALLDATNWEQFKPGNFLENRLSYSAYKHMNVFQVLFGKSIDAFLWFPLKILHFSSRFN